jgi:hypothetical protein
MLSKYILKMSTPNFSKKSSTENAAAKGKGRSSLVQDGNLMAGNSSGEYEYLRLQELKAKILDFTDVAQNPNLAKLASTIRNESEQEALAHQILIQLNGMSDYSAEFAQISSVCGTGNRVEIAQELSQKYCDNYSTKRIMDRLVNPKSDALGSVEHAFTDTYNAAPSAWSHVDVKGAQTDRKKKAAALYK